MDISISSDYAIQLDTLSKGINLNEHRIVPYQPPYRIGERPVNESIMDDMI